MRIFEYPQSCIIFVDFVAATLAGKGEADLFEDADYIDRASFTLSNNTLAGSPLGSCGTSLPRKALARGAGGGPMKLSHSDVQ